MTTRITTNLTDFNWVRVIVDWRERTGQSSGADDFIRIKLRVNGVRSLADGGGTFGEDVIWGNKCFDEHSGDAWERCEQGFNLPDRAVQDLRVMIFNETEQQCSGCAVIEVDQLSAKSN
jgi:hypothetical protein